MDVIHPEAEGEATAFRDITEPETSGLKQGQNLHWLCHPLSGNSILLFYTKAVFISNQYDLKNLLLYSVSIKIVFLVLTVLH